jgi:hypothetical protein
MGAWSEELKANDSALDALLSYEESGVFNAERLMGESANYFG